MILGVMTKATRALGGLLASLLGRARLTEALALGGGPYALHVSDTPSAFYPELRRVIGILNPEYILHTGDLVDNLKLQLYPSLSVRYERELAALLRLLDSSRAREIHIALGNHDDESAVARRAGRARIYPEGGRVTLGGIDIAFGHYAPTTPPTDRPARIYLYGHDLSIPSYSGQDCSYLNGVEAMHLIDLDSGRYVAIDYPVGTESARLNHYRARI